MNQTQAITQYHPTLERIAYRILQSKADAEDILQDTYLKFLTVKPDHIQNLKAYLIGAVVNNCLAHIKNLNRKKEEYLEELSTQDIWMRIADTDFFNFDFQEEVAEAFAVVQTKLEPLERAVYLLKEVFDLDYDTLQETLDKRKDHCRQLYSRARRKLFQESEKFQFPITIKTDLFDSFKNSCYFGNPSEFILQVKEDLTKALKNKF